MQQLQQQQQKIECATDSESKNENENTPDNYTPDNSDYEIEEIEEEE